MTIMMAIAGNLIMAKATTFFYTEDILAFYNSVDQQLG